MKRSWMAMLVVGVAMGAQAQVLDLQTGRGADLAGAAKFSIEGGMVLGDLDYFGARGNWLVGEGLLVGGNLGQVGDSYDDELAGGVFAMYQLPAGQALPIALKAGYDMTLDGDIDVSDLSLQVIVSGPINQQVGWYANGGVHIVSSEETQVSHHEYGTVTISYDDDDVIPALGGGVLFDINDQASAFLGVDVLLGDLYDDTVVGAGFRWSFR